MMNELTKLIVNLNKLAILTTELVAKNLNQPYQPELPAEPVAPAKTEAPAPAEEAPKKVRKPRTPKVTPAPETVATEAPAPAAKEEKEEKEESFEDLQRRAFELTSTFVKMTANEDPTGQVWAKTVLLPKYGVATMADMNEQQYKDWVKDIAAEIAKREGKA